jgi:hypothetical protein
MSADFPIREDWLRLRDMKPKPPRIFHLSAELVRRPNPSGTGWHLAVKRPGKTYLRASDASY